MVNKKHKRTPEGIVLNKDGLPRKGLLSYEREKIISRCKSAHRKGSLGEDQESILI